MSYSIFKRCAVVMFAWGYWVMGLLWRWPLGKSEPRPPDGGPCIYAHWHGDELVLIRRYAFFKKAVMASLSNDGSLLSIALKWLGFLVVRGSSSRGGIGGLKALADAIKKGSDVALAVDGPRGPIYEVKPGVLKLAQLTGRPILPLAAAAKSKFVFAKSWNKCFYPMPFSGVAVGYGDFFWVPRDLKGEAFEEKRRELEIKISEVKTRVERKFQAPQLKPLFAEV